MSTGIIFRQSGYTVGTINAPITLDSEAEFLFDGDSWRLSISSQDFDYAGKSIKDLFTTLGSNIVKLDTIIITYVTDAGKKVLRWLEPKITFTHKPWGIMLEIEGKEVC